MPPEDRRGAGLVDAGTLTEPTTPPRPSQPSPVLAAALLSVLLLLSGARLSIASPGEPRGGSESTAAVGVLGSPAVVEALRDRGLPVFAASLSCLEGETPPALLVAQAGRVGTEAAAQGLARYLESGGKLLLTGWGAVVSPSLRSRAPLYSLERLLGVRVISYSASGNRWVQLREPGLQPDPGWETVVDLGDGPSLVVELAPGASEWGRWVAAGRAVRGGARSAAIVGTGAAALVGRDLLAPEWLNPAGMDLVASLIARLLSGSGPAARDAAPAPDRSRDAVPPASDASPEGPRPGGAAPRAAEVQALWLPGQEAAQLSLPDADRVNTVILSLVDVLGALSPRSWEDPASRGRLAAAAAEVRRGGRCLWIQLPVLRAGDGRRQGQWLRAHPDWAVPGATLFNPSLEPFREALAVRVRAAVDLLRPDGVLLTHWHSAAADEESRRLLDRLAEVVASAVPEALLLVSPASNADDGAAPDGDGEGARLLVYRPAADGPRSEGGPAYHLEVVGLQAVLEGSASVGTGAQEVGRLGTVLRLPRGGLPGASASVAFPGLSRALRALFPAAARAPQADPLGAASLLLASAAEAAPALRSALGRLQLDLARMRLPDGAAARESARRGLERLRARARRLPAAVRRDLEAAAFWLGRAEGRPRPEAEG